MNEQERRDKIQLLIDAVVALKAGGMEACEICYIAFTEAQLTPQQFNRLMNGRDIEPIKLERCPACHGRGEWETECCDGSRGCSCRGERVPMGNCNVCNGSGHVVEGHCDPRANLRMIEGMAYTGSGPRR